MISNAARLRIAFPGWLLDHDVLWVDPRERESE